MKDVTNLLQNKSRQVKRDDKRGLENHLKGLNPMNPGQIAFTLENAQKLAEYYDTELNLQREAFTAEVAKVNQAVYHRDSIIGTLLQTMYRLGVINEEDMNDTIRLNQLDAVKVVMDEKAKDESLEKVIADAEDDYLTQTVLSPALSSEDELEVDLPPEHFEEVNGEYIPLRRTLEPPYSEELHRPDYWAGMEGIVILDNDGFPTTWNTLMEYSEYQKGIESCTIKRLYDVTEEDLTHMPL